MNRCEWKNSYKLGIKLDYTYYNKSHKLMTQFNEFNKFTDENLKTEVHHLRDTEEQRKYNDTYYERWGFNEDGTFEYGKYVIFVTHKEHCCIHSVSEETKNKLRSLWENEDYRSRITSSQRKSWTEERKRLHSQSVKERYSNEDYRLKMSAITKRLWKDESYRIKVCKNRKGRQAWNRGIPCSSETKSKISLANKGYIASDETREKLSKSTKQLWQNEDFRLMMKEAHSFCHTEQYRDQCKQIISNVKEQYTEYKKSGGTLKWNEFQKYLKKYKTIPPVETLETLPE